MKGVRFTLLVLLLIGCLPAFGQLENLRRDLREDWTVLDESRYRSFENDRVKTIYLSVDATRYRGGFLQVEDSKPFALFINRQLIIERPKGMVSLNMDSLSKMYSSLWSVSIFQRGGVNTLSSRVLLPVSGKSDDMDPYARIGNYFLDFALTASLALLVYLVFLVASNARLALDYLNAGKLFSIQEREGNLLTTRITSRVNLLFYLFGSIYCALLLLIIFHLSEGRIPLSYYFPIRSTGEGFLQWLKLSFLISALLVLKLVIVLAFSRLFNMRETAAIQYFHFIRALFLASGFITLISIINFIFDGSNGNLHFTLLKIGAGVMVVSAGMMYLKLLGLTRYHFFHLFSYLCASEIIPLVILLKVLLY